MKEEQPHFTVTDRRLFNADGTPRDIQADAVAETPPAPSAEPSSDSSTPGSEPDLSTAAVSESDATDAEAEQFEEGFDDEEISDAADPASFINFAMSIASNAASALG